MRGTTAPEVYGKINLPSEVKSRVRTQTQAAFRCAELAARLHSQGTPWIIECPGEEEPSVFDLPEVRGLLTLVSQPHRPITILVAISTTASRFSATSNSTGRTKVKTICPDAGGSFCVIIGVRQH